MMLTGNLVRNRATAITYTETRSSVTGATKKVETIGSVFHFFRQTKKEQYALLNGEEGRTGTIIMQCRRGPATEAMTHFRYEGELYRIEQKTLDQLHNTYDITAKKVQE